MNKHFYLSKKLGTFILNEKFNGYENKVKWGDTTVNLVLLALDDELKIVENNVNKVWDNRTEWDEEFISEIVTYLDIKGAIKLNIDSILFHNNSEFEVFFNNRVGEDTINIYASITDGVKSVSLVNR